jgi:hypothetical protein
LRPQVSANRLKHPKVTRPVLSAGGGVTAGA